MVMLETRTEAVPVIRKDDPNIVLLVVDMQHDFSDPEGSLYVPGAEDDVVRMASFIKENARYIKRIIPTADSHRLTMVSTPHFLVNQHGEHPKTWPIQTYTPYDFRSGRWRVNPSIVPLLPGGRSEEFINKFLEYYVWQLEELGRPPLLTWPQHCHTATAGQMIVPELYEAIQWHEFTRGGLNPVMTKGECPFLECFSAVGPDILTFHDLSPIPLAQRNEELLDYVREADVLIVGGEASTHCVPATLFDLLDEIPDLGPKVYMLEDAMSPVGTFEQLAAANRRKFESRGVTYVSTTTPIREWGGKIEKFLN